MNVALTYISDFFSLFFPEVCYCCGRSLVRNESVICTECAFDLPYTNFHLDPDNQLSRQFRGRLELGFALACFYFHRESRVQHLIHHLKYKNKPEIGHWFGKVYGTKIKKFITSDYPDLIVPVPLHPKRQKRRGYNQSECIADGMSEALGIPVISDCLQRKVYTETQTSKPVFSRLENMKDVFHVTRPEFVSGKHILLIDDVITTGATIEACALSLLSLPSVKISIAAIAFTK